MHIKQIIIQGFKSYKEQTALEPFSPGTNVIVGRNGSGKSNFFAAIRFVLSDAYTNLTREERQGLLHEGSGSAVMSAYVEIIFDNTDRRFNEPDDEFVIRRTIGLKKDEYSVNKKVQPRSEVLKALEHAGFAKENPFYIVPQGRVAHITNMKETDRLNLLKEIAGTNTYEDRRVQSLKIMAETNSKREKIDELLNYIKDRLNELEEEKDELRSWQDKDRERKCLEYAYFHHEHERINELLAEIEEARSENANSETASSIELREREMAKIDKWLRDMKQDLELAAIERRQLDEDRKSAARARAKAELTAKRLDETRHAREESHRQREADLEAVQQQTQEKEAQLAGILPEYEKWKAEEGRVRTEYQAAEAGRNRLMKKQEHGNQFRTKAERDAFLKEEINDLTQAIAQLKANGLDNREEVATGEATIKELDQEIEKTKANIAGYGGRRAALAEKVSGAQETREALTEERKRLHREEEKLNAMLKSVREERQAAQKDLSKAMDSGTSRGLESIRRLKQEKDIPGAYGTVAELMQVTHDVYRLAVEQTAGNSLFQYVVDNHQTGSMLSEHLYKTFGGRVTFIPLEQLRVRQVKMPRAPDAQPLISKIEFDPKFEPAFQQIFGKTVICPSLQVCSQYSRSHNVNAITPDGDTTDRRGAITGGYIDTRRSRLETVRRVGEVRDRFEKLETEAHELGEKIRELDQQVTEALGTERRLNQDLIRFERGFEPLKAELQEKIKQLAREKLALEAAKGRCAEVEERLDGFDQSLAALQAELETDFKTALSAREESDLEQFTANMFRLQKQLQEVSKKRRELEARKNQLEVDLSQNLRPQAEQLSSQAFDATGDADGGGGAGGDGSGGGYQDAQRELKKAQRAVTKVEKELLENDKKMEALNAEIMTREAERADKEKEKQDLAEELEKEQRRLRRKIQQKAVLTSQADEWAAKIRDLGVIPEEAFGKYERMKTEQITNRLKKVNEALRKFKHINKKALEQYNSFMTQQEQLLKRRKELDASHSSIEELIQHLDQAKDEAIERTFKQVSREFATIFEQLVPAGHGRLVIQKKMDRGPAGKKKGRKSQAAAAAAAEESDDEDHEATGVDNYTGVGISVSFNSKVLDEQQKIQQLSGGQKSLCALCLIFALQAAESSPFVIFDEVDANLDAQYRTAVAGLLDSISKTQSTQFICTTFRPEIVLVADKCYGVTFHNKTSTIDCVPTEEALNFVEGQQKK